MTKEEILAMEANEELDKLVAVEVMNELMSDLFIPENALEHQLAGSPIKSGGGNWVCLCKYEEGDIPRWHPLPFSTDISAAWQVVEAIHKELFSIRHFFLRFLQEQTRHEVNGGAGEIVTIAWPDLFFHITPETICKAALIAKLEEADK